METASLGGAAGELKRHRLKRRRGRFLKVRRALNHDNAGAVLAAALAVLLIFLAVPRFTAELLGVGSLPTLGQLQRGLPISEPDLAEAVKQLDSAVNIDSHDARRLTDLGLIYLMQAQHQGLDTDGGQAKLLAGMKALEDGLSRSPANSFAWARLAWARLARDQGPSPGAIKALRMSYLTGPYVDRVMPYRADLSLRLWERLDSELTESATRELTYLWGRSWDDQKHLMDSVCRYGRAFVLAQALRESSSGIAEFDRLYPYFMTPEACKERTLQ